MDDNEFKTLSGYIQVGYGLDVGSGGCKIYKDNVISIDKENPHAKIIGDFLSCNAEAYTGCDFIMMTHYLRFVDSPVQHIRKAWNILKPGGRLLITEQIQREQTAKHWWLPQELEGFLYLFNKFFFIEHKTDNKNGKSYTIILQRRIPNVKQVSEDRGGGDKGKGG